VSTRTILSLSLAVWLGAAGTASGEAPVYPSPEAVEPLAPGSAVPSVEVQTVGGESVDLAAQVRDAGALLVFYRGGW
jgi:hypothetical protein